MRQIIDTLELDEQAKKLLKSLSPDWEAVLKLDWKMVSRVASNFNLVLTEDVLEQLKREAAGT